MCPHEARSENKGGTTTIVPRVLFHISVASATTTRVQTKLISFSHLAEREGQQERELRKDIHWLVFPATVSGEPDLARELHQEPAHDVEEKPNGCLAPPFRIKLVFHRFAV